MINNLFTHIIRHIKFLLVFLLLISANLRVYSQTPVADFTADETIGCEFLLVTFTDLSTNSPDSWQWYFGDGGTSFLQNPTYVYNFPGVYTVMLIATNASGSDTIIKNNYITVFNSPNPDFTTDVSSGCVPLTVNFTDLSTSGDAPITGWQWDFGDGHFSAIQDPMHQFTDPNIYQVSLRVTDTNGCSEQIIYYEDIIVVPLPDISFDCSSQFACDTPFIVDFYNTSPDPNLTFLWDFGDGSPTSTQENPSHTYNSLGYFDVILIATDTVGCSDTLLKPNYIGISGNITYTADFSVTDTVGCNPPNVHFTDQSTIGTDSWHWEFGDGDTSAVQSPYHVYGASGNYTVTLITTNSIPCADVSGDTVIKNVNITIYGVPVINFSLDNNVGCNVPFSVNFTDSTIGAVSWQWNFGDGGTSFVQNPSHIYNNTGDYNVSLTITDSNGCTDQGTELITIYEPFAYFTASPEEGCAPLDVAFTDLSYSNSTIISWQWDFGDGSPVDTLQNPLHTFVDTGTYTVTLTIQDSLGCIKTLVLDGYIKVGIPPVVNFAADDTVGCHPLTVTFYDSSSVYTDSWYWDFGDGNNSDVQNPIHTYTDTGYFDVQLIASFNGCADSILFQNYIYVFPPKPEFTVTPSEISCEYPFLVSFIDQSQGAETWEWDFGDGSPVSTLQNPTHTYWNPGFYTVKLTVSADNPPFCMDSIIKIEFIKISEINPGFTQNDSTTCQYVGVTYTDTSYANTSIVNSEWHFGDGATGTGQIITHQYANSGTYSVELVVTDALGCEDSITKTNTIIVFELPSPRFSADVTTGCVPLTVTFDPSLSTAVAPANLIMWIWNFGDGTPPDTTFNSLPVTHIYTTRSYPGSYNVGLTVVDSKGCDSTLIKYSYITPTYPYPDFVFNSLICYYDFAVFTNNSTGTGLSYSWDFGDGSPADTSMNPMHLYDTTVVDTTMTLDVMLTVTDTNGCDSSVTKQITVSRPIAMFNSDSIYSSCPPFFVTFTDSSTADVISWYWDFGDTASGTSNHAYIPNPQHIFNYAGQYDVSLIVTNIYGCVDTIIKNDYIIDGPKGSFVYYPKYGCQPLEVTFVSDTQDVSSFLWVFGDGSSSSAGDSIVYIYTDTGTFIPTLILQDTVIDAIYGDTIICSVNIPGNDTIRIFPTPAADFNFTTGCPYTDIIFTDASTIASGNIISYDWNFGDGTTGTGQTTIHQYAYGGNYNVTLIVTSDLGCTDTITKQVDIYYDPVVNFSNTIVCLNDTTNFTDLTTTINSTIISWYWDFDDGNFSTIQNPSHFYNASGNYNVNLIIITSDSCSHDTTIVVHVNYLPIANFFVDSSVCANNNTYFYDSSINPPDGSVTFWYWDFGDGGNSNIQNPVYIYTSEGIVVVTLTITTNTGCTDSKIDTIQVYPSPIVNFTSTKVCLNLASDFTDNSSISSGNIILWQWDFGDGDSSSIQNPSHTFLSSGTHNVTLTLTSDKGCVSSITNDVVVYPLPEANLGLSSHCYGVPIQFNDLSTIQTGSITSWQWDFGDGSSVSILQNPIHIYNSSGIYDIILIVSSQYSCTDTVHYQADISPTPVADFSAVPINGCSPLSVNFTDLSSISNGDIVSWYWSFGDGIFSTIQNPIHIYDSAGVYDVSLTVISDCGISDMLTVNGLITVYITPIADFSAVPQSTSIIFPTISFTDLSTDATDWYWTFGDGDSSYIQNPTHTYSDTGTFYVTLVVINDSYNCSDSISKYVTINPEFVFYVPNTFTPNANGKNDIFNGYGMSIAEYELYIYNRWGGLVFKSNDMYEGWDGTSMFGDKTVQQGVYVYLFILKDKLSKKHEIIGHVTLLN